MKVQLILLVAIYLSTSLVLGDSKQKVRAECQEPVNYGECSKGSMNLRRFYYDAAENKCKQFKFGGCNRNSNNFRTAKACLAYCQNTPENVCNQNEKASTCLANMRRYRYNPVDKTCKKYLYGGCGGDENNFKTAEACNDFCAGV